MISAIANLFCSDESDRVETSLKITPRGAFPCMGFIQESAVPKGLKKGLKFERPFRFEIRTFFTLAWHQIFCLQRTTLFHFSIDKFVILPKFLHKWKPFLASCGPTLDLCANFKGLKQGGEFSLSFEIGYGKSHVLVLNTPHIAPNLWEVLYQPGGCTHNSSGSSLQSFALKLNMLSREYCLFKICHQR